MRGNSVSRSRFVSRHFPTSCAKIWEWDMCYDPNSHCPNLSRNTYSNSLLSLLILPLLFSRLLKLFTLRESPPGLKGRV